MKAYSNVVFLLLLLFIQTSQLCFCKNSTSACNELERQALLTFRSSFKNTPPGSPLASWEGNDCCQWKGVGCHDVTGPVIKLDLRLALCDSWDCFYYYRLKAEVMNPSLVELEHLNHLDLSGIDFDHSPIPAFLGSMKQLRYLNLRYCGLSGRIPHHLGNLSNLRVLDVSYNFGLYGDDMGWVSKLSSLKHLAMHRVSLEKAYNMFQVLYMLPSLSHAYFTSCGLTIHHFDPRGPVNSTFRSNVEVLHLAYNSLNGSIPDAFINMSSIKDLDLSFNYFSSVPHWFGNLHSLVHLDLRCNSLKGSVPDAFQNLTSIRDLYLFGNALSSIPHLLGNLHSLVHLDLGNNALKGPIPDAFQNMTSIRDLDLSGNALSSIPHQFGNLHSLVHLDLGNNALKFLIPDAFQNMTSIRDLGLSRNALSSIPHRLGNLHSLVQLDLGDNFLKGSVPHAFQNLTSIRVLRLSENALSSVPHWLGNLHFLVHLDLGNNALKGPIPDAFQNSSIEDLYLYGNALSSIPHWLGNLHSLVILDLSFNYFNSIQGSIASILRNTCFLQSFILSMNLQGKGGSPISFGTGNLSECKRYDLEYLFLDKSSITGTLPSWLGDLKSLKALHLEGNLIHGQIPSSLGQLSSLSELYLSDNHLTGTIPNEIGALSNLVALDFSNNQLKGAIPNSVGQLTNLRELRISNNSLEGTFSELHLCNVSNMEELDVGFNNLTVRIDSNWTPPFQLIELGMASCNIGTQFPQWLQSQKRRLSTLDLSNNNIRGMIPNWFHKMVFSDLMPVLDLSNNLISGSIPNNFGDRIYRGELILKSNLFEGSIPESLCGLDMSVLDLSDNRLSGKIPSCCWKNGKGSYILNLSSNKLSGTISSSFRNISNVSWLNLSNNSLHGEISQVLRNIQQVQILDVGGNQFSGMIPPEIGQGHAFQMLQVLRLSHNLLSGGIPPSLCQLRSLQILDLASNKLSGSIPPCICNLRGMVKQSTYDKNAYSHFTDSDAPAVAPSLDAMYDLPAAPLPPTDQWEKEDLKQVLKGLELDYTKNLKYLINIDLSDNNLTGLIPEGLTCLSGLIGLNLAHNKLSGGIPSKIGKMKSLESFDLSSNQLYGSIPISMSTLTYLEFLNLSNNNFSGPIPKGPQFSTFDPSSFIGNPYLCGDPLSNPCGSDHGTKAESEIKSGNDEGKEKLLFYFVIALGFITGFWGVIGILVFKRRWRHALFQYVDGFVDTMYVEIVIRVARFKKMINPNQVHQ